MLCLMVLYDRSLQPPYYYATRNGEFLRSLSTIVVIRRKVSLMIAVNGHRKRLPVFVVIDWYTAVYDREWLTWERLWILYSYYKY